MHQTMRERFPVDSPRREQVQIGRQLARWFCPGCGVPLDESNCCPQCGHSIRDQIYPLVELHPHSDEERALKYERDLEEVRWRQQRPPKQPRPGKYDFLTDRARKVMQLANQEAQRLNRQSVGTEHILLALLREGTGVAANVLVNFGLHLGQVQAAVRSLSGLGPALETPCNLPLTARATRTIEHSLDEASRLDHHYVGTEHLLLALLRDPENSAVQILGAFGLTPAEIRREVLNLLGHDLFEDLGET
jgi:ClpA/ClpB-like protein